MAKIAVKSPKAKREEYGGDGLSPNAPTMSEIPAITATIASQFGMTLLFHTAHPRMMRPVPMAMLARASHGSVSWYQTAASYDAVAEVGAAVVEILHRAPYETICSVAESNSPPTASKTPADTSPGFFRRTIEPRRATKGINPTAYTALNKRLKAN